MDNNSLRGAMVLLSTTSPDMQIAILVEFDFVGQVFVMN